MINPTPRWTLLLLALAAGLAAQTGTSSITGTITDSTGAAVAKAQIQIINEETGAAMHTESNSEGVYRAPSLAPGLYRIEADLPGFEKSVRRGVTLQVSQTLPVDLALQLGQATESVNVEAAPPLTETQSSSTGQLVGRKMVEDLPIPNRAATSMVALAPGAVVIDSGAGAENYPLFSVAGGRVRNQNFTLDGGNVTNAVGLTRPQQMTSLPIDAMQEFRVISNNYAAEYGHSTGGVITLSTRSGTNQYHGSLFDYQRNDALDARNFFAVSKPPLRLSQFGATLGGPIQKDKTHFFVSWEQTRETSSVTLLQTVPDLLERNGNFSGLRDAGGNLIQIYDPRNGRPFAGNMIPVSRFDPVGRAVLNFFPLPNRSGANNFGANSKSLLNRNIVVGKLDHQLREADHLSARYYINDSFTDNQGSFGIPVSDPNADKTDVRVQSVMLSETHIFSPRLVNEVSVSYLQRKFIDRRYGFGAGFASQLGLTGVSAAAFPTFTLPGYVSLAGEPARFQTPIRDTQFQEALSHYRGKHAVKIGAEYRRGFNNETRDRSSSGAFGITPLITGQPGVAGTGDSIASLLLGQVNSAGVQVSDAIASHASYWAWYAQDDWRVTDRLTLNYGLRWEAEIPRHVDGNRQNSFDPAPINPVSGTPGVVTFAGVNGVPRNAFHTDLNNFGPRAGFAWRLPFAGEIVLRGGGGVFYGPTVSNSIGDAAATGFSTAASLVASQADTQSVLELRDGFPALIRPPLTSGYGAVAPGQRPNTAVGFFRPDQPTPISYQYNFNVQRELARNIVLELGYIGNVSHHLTGNDLSLDQVAPQLAGPGDAQSRRPFPQFSNVFWINPAIGNSTYHGGYIKAEKRFSDGFSFLAHYTYSKFIDDVASSVEYGDPASYMDAYNRRLDKSLSGSDVPHRAILSGVYEMRRFGGNKMISALGGWNVALLATLQSGAPFTVTTLANTTNAFPAGPLRPDLIAAPELSGGQSIAHWFNTAAFRAPAQFRFGNAPRSVLRGAPLKTVDLTLARQFAVKERYHADLRAEFYNLLNHANFNIPGDVLGAADFGVVSSARPARTVQLGLRFSF
jgi:hypothetical protein